MKKIALFVFLSFPVFCFSQTVVETVKLKNDKYATLYDDGTWRYTSIPTPASTGNVESSKSSIIPLRSSTPEKSSSSPASSSYSSACGARTKAGGSCKRMVKGGGRCWQH